MYPRHAEVKKIPLYGSERKPYFSNIEADSEIGNYFPFSSIGFKYPRTVNSNISFCWSEDIDENDEYEYFDLMQSTSESPFQPSILLSSKGVHLNCFEIPVWDHNLLDIDVNAGTVYDLVQSGFLRLKISGSNQWRILSNENFQILQNYMDTTDAVEDSILTTNNNIHDYCQEHVATRLREHSITITSMNTNDYLYQYEESLLLSSFNLSEASPIQHSPKMLINDLMGVRESCPPIDFSLNSFYKSKFLKQINALDVEEENDSMQLMACGWSLRSVGANKACYGLSEIRCLPNVVTAAAARARPASCWGRDGDDDDGGGGGSSEWSAHTYLIASGMPSASSTAVLQPFLHIKGTTATCGVHQNKGLHKTNERSRKRDAAGVYDLMSAKRMRSVWTPRPGCESDLESNLLELNAACPYLPLPIPAFPSVSTARQHLICQHLLFTRRSSCVRKPQRNYVSCSIASAMKDLELDMTPNVGSGSDAMARADGLHSLTLHGFTSLAFKEVHRSSPDAFAASNQSTADTFTAPAVAEAEAASDDELRHLHSSDADSTSPRRRAAAATTHKEIMSSAFNLREEQEDGVVMMETSPGSSRVVKSPLLATPAGKVQPDVSAISEAAENRILPVDLAAAASTATALVSESASVLCEAAAADVVDLARDRSYAPPDDQLQSVVDSYLLLLNPSRGAHSAVSSSTKAEYPVRRRDAAVVTESVIAPVTAASVPFRSVTMAATSSSAAHAESFETNQQQQRNVDFHFSGLRVLVADSMLGGSMVALLSDLSRAHGVASIDCAVEPPVSVVIDASTCVCIVTSRTLLHMPALKAFVKALTNIAFKYKRIWIVIHHDALGAGAGYSKSSVSGTNQSKTLVVDADAVCGDKKLEMMLVLYKALLYFPVTTIVREAFTDNCLKNLIFTAVKDSMQRHIDFSNSHFNTRNSASSDDGGGVGTMICPLDKKSCIAERGFLDLLLSNHKFKQQAEFLQMFPTINIYVACLLLSSCQLKELAVMSAEELCNRFPNIESACLERLHEMMHEHIGITTKLHP